jgi:cell division GTPase FtsZ
MIKDVLQIIGCGQCGTRLGLEFSKLGVDVLYINSDEMDVRGTLIDPKKMLLLGTTGTGGSTVKGKELIDTNQDNFTTFMDRNIDKSKIIMAVCGLGGGTGGSVAPFVIDYLNKKDIKAGCLATLPPRMLGILASDNSLKTLKQLRDLKISMFILADNEFLMAKKGLGAEWWEKVNREIVEQIASVFDLLRSGKVTQAGFGSIDKAEILRILQFGNGLIDMRTVYLNYSDLKVEEGEIAAKLFTPSIIEGFRYKETLAYLVGIDIPKKKDFMVDAKKVFDITKKTAGSAISRLGMFVDPMLSEVIRVTMINAGLKLPRVLQSRINHLKRDEIRFKDKKSKEDILDLSELDKELLEEEFNI